MGRWDRFEQVILRVARANFLALSFVAAAIFVIGLVLLPASQLRGGVSKPQLPPEVAAAEPLTLPAVEKWVAEHPKDARSDDAAAPSWSGTREEGTLPDALHTLFPTPPYSMTDQFEEVCKVPTSYGCLQRGKRLVKPSVPRIVYGVLAGIPDGEANSEMLSAVAAPLRSAPVEQRLQLLAPAVAAYRSVNAKHLDLVHQRDEQVEKLQRAYQQQVAELNEWRAMMVASGVYLMGSGFSMLIALSMFLAFLAIERHLRRLANPTNRGV